MMRMATIGGRRVMFVMATDHEYGPFLEARFVPLVTGVGPVEAAIGVTQALCALAATGALPDLVVSIGSAGSRTLPLGSVWQVASVSWRDMDATRIGVPKGVTPFSDHAAELPLATPIAGWPVARLSTGANIVGGDEYDAIDADMVDMETFAVLRACQRFGVAVMGLRGISDGPGELETLGGWTAMLGVLDERLAAAVDRLG
ncbi:5'-methylthioadenosine nucleosidase [Sphingomonas sp. Leaf407]|uniref:5'-methylthioadenosine/S-adenosylhomocysteine nucleosidase n=1 Tax=unclassified Sphingomonas TaxID=196159 RepID=UPI0006F6EB1D|nr:MULTISPECIES: 5'-methylthioadenosine/S-adenosylhomocysteine nucleosidase [unclassified Sphingomonas]KQN34224.1 5'-methylthioadenosine nucleosidase [Sphingomonas sp. Leaf42]KQT30667.1 5'-methylthioadenosine nucleosidase [Sphingomonas sp. Leaf407]